MGKIRGSYKEEFPSGSRVKIVNRADLASFFNNWKLHNPLEPWQLDFANQVAEVESVSFYHSGDELYKLKNIPGIWHEENLESCGDLDA